MTTVELSVNPDYVRNWGVWEALRELAQNALDARDRGSRLEVARGKGARQTVRITNHGVVLERRTLLLGGTDKLGDPDQRGRFGEGYKLALLVLTRLGIEVQIRTGDEMWTPYIEPSAAFGGAECLKIRIRKCAYEHKIEVLIHGLTDEHWATFATRVRAANLGGDTSPAVRVGKSSLLTSPADAGSLYVRGLYVGPLPGSAYKYGYDLHEVELDRDRKMADWWSLRAAVQNALLHAVDQLGVEEIYALLNSDFAETQLIESYYQYSAVGSDALTTAIAAQFRAYHGNDAVPAHSADEAMQAQHFGIRAVVVNAGLYRALVQSVPPLDRVKAARRLETRTVITPDMLTEQERTNLEWALATMKRGVDYSGVNVVEFLADDVNGTWSAEHGVRIARHRLADREQLLSTLVHEVAHAVDGAQDGTLLHTHRIQEILVRIILSSWSKS